MQVGIVILGAAVTYSTDRADCNRSLYGYASITIGMGLATFGDPPLVSPSCSLATLPCAPVLTTHYKTGFIFLLIFKEKGQAYMSNRGVIRGPNWHVERTLRPK